MPQDGAEWGWKGRTRGGAEPVEEKGGKGEGRGRRRAKTGRREKRKGDSTLVVGRIDAPG